MRPLAPALALALALAGCVAPTLSAPPPSLDGARTGWLAADGNLTQAPGATPSTIRMGSFFEAWQEGRDYPTFRATALERDVVVEGIAATVRVSVTGPVARTARFPDIMVYGGSGDAWMAIGTVQTPPVLVPGEEYAFDVAVEGPPGGLYVPAGERLGVKVVAVMTQSDGFDVLLHVGGPDGSLATWTQRQVDPPQPAAFETGQDSADLVGSAYAGDAATGSERHETIVVANATPRLLLAWMNTTAHEGVPDLDVYVLAPDGEQLAFSGTPTPREMLRLGPENLRGPGEYRLVVASYGSARASATIEWAAGT